MQRVPPRDFIAGVGLKLQPGKFYDWRLRYGRVNEHNQAVPRDHWIEPWEREAILRYRAEYPLEGYRRLSFMMLDAGVVAVSPSTVYRILSAAGVLDRYSRRVSKKGTGFRQPTHPHEHWHIDVSYINLGGTFYYLCSLLDGYSRLIVHWELHESMKEPEVELVIQRAREKHPSKEFVYAWPFPARDIARFLSGQISLFI